MDVDSERVRSLEVILGRKNNSNLQKFFKINKFSKTEGVVVFGTGNCGALVLSGLKRANINVICLSDNNKSRWGKTINGYKVVPPEELKSTKNQTPILIASDLSFPYMRRQLKDLGLTNVHDCDFIFF